MLRVDYEKGVLVLQKRQGRCCEAEAGWPRKCEGKGWALLPHEPRSDQRNRTIDSADSPVHRKASTTSDNRTKESCAVCNNSLLYERGCVR